MVRLSKRLATIARMVSPGSKVIDIGCDHGYLGIYLVTEKIASHVIVSDVNEQPLNVALNNIINYGLEQAIETRLGNGLEPLSEADDIDTIVISGMGGKLITEILDNGNVKIESIIVQPNNSISDVRKWLVSNNYKIIKETLVKDNGHIYEIIKGVSGTQKLSQDEIDFGPLLINQKSPLFIEKYHRELLKNINILNNLPLDNKDYQKIENRINKLTQIIK